MLSVLLPVFRRRTWIVVVTLAGGFLAAERGNAQQDTLRGTNPTPTDSMKAIAARIKSDTGRMMPGYRDLSRYDNPGMCLVAMQGVQDAIWRRIESDTIPRYTPRDTIPTAVREIGRSCLSRMTPQSVDSAQLFDLMVAAIKVGDTALARNTVVYHASKITRGVRERGFVFVDAMELAFEGRPSQWVWAESLFPQILALGADAQEPLTAALQLRWSDAHARFDHAALARLDADRVATFQRLFAEGKVKDSSFLGLTYEDSIDVVEFQRGPNFRETMQRVGDRYVAMASGSEIGRTMAEGLVDVRLGTTKLFGAPAPQLAMFQRYPTDAPTTPVPGRVTLVAYIDKLGNGLFEPYLATLRRLHEKYHDRGLDIILIAQTKGYAWESPPLDSTQEAKLIGWYYREHLKLPFTVFVSKADFGRLSDGRITRGRSKEKPTIGVYRYWRPWWWYIVARDGTIADHINGPSVSVREENRVDAIIRRELDSQLRAQQ